MNNATRKMQFLFALRSKGVTDARVLSAMEKIDRGDFVKGLFEERAYEDTPLPIACGQTISQPSVVGLMTQALKVQPRDKVLEVGTGSGYQAAILTELNCSVYSIERSASLARQAKNILAELGYCACPGGAEIKIGDGTKGWPEFSPYTKIIVTAAAPKVPLSLFTQLTEDGMMVIPLGDRFVQMLSLVRKIKGKMRNENICSCRFVPLIGEEGWR
ncbi:MAG: protein-L-isoaspartate(D-aspartate) O-methyltransferase [Marinosulfonomonas sp.]|nr:protein-L-isoaspartate(D-aspartate) O-methyltransferase [Marinosulfonomonas sp.]